MHYTMKAIYRDGAFVPEVPCDIPEDARVELTVQGPLSTPPAVTDPQERAKILAQVTERMRQNPIPEEAPRFSREELHERG